MFETETLEQDMAEGTGNRVSQLSAEERRKIASLMSSRWRMATRHREQSGALENHRLGWEFYLSNKVRPQEASGGNFSRLDGTVTPTPEHTTLRLGDIPRSVDAVKALLMNSLFPADERFFRGTPKNPLSAEFQDAYETHLSTTFSEDTLMAQLDALLLNLCIDPAAAVAVHYRQKKQRRVVYDYPGIVIGETRIPLPMLGLKKQVLNDEVVWEGTQCEVLDYMDWRVNPQAKSMAESWFMRRWYEPVHAVKAQYGLERLQPYAACTDNTTAADGGDETLLPIDASLEDAASEQALMMVCYDDFVLGDTVYKNHVAVTVNGSTLVWFGENPYDHGEKPYLIHALKPLPNQIEGMSLIHHALPSAMVKDVALSKIMKTAAWAADPIFEVDHSEKAFKTNRGVRPGMKYPVKRLGASIKQIPVNIANLNIMLDIIARSEETIRQTTGASQVFTGEDPLGHTNVTAFQVDQHIQGANSRFQVMMTQFNNAVLEPLLKMSFENDRQFKMHSVFVDGQGTLTPALIKQLDFKWIVTSAQAANSRGRQLANMRVFLFEMLPAMVAAGVARLDDKELVVDAVRATKDFLRFAGLNRAEDWLQEGGRVRE